MTCSNCNRPIEAVCVPFISGGVLHSFVHKGTSNGWCETLANCVDNKLHAVLGFKSYYLLLK